ncbi:hypothetical protein BOTBODRAFT_60446 [Botryobasidium botryosum FD-172 SS1]|uniref:Mitochondrial adapter protein MCP1 transmembrane domain-containing protein n=1 Tax=Botryobasidium botryosum (strain FD-172 SS1) TaxID=930990 RepID=A0A067LTU4_BOTB1|nr:hypothetical protein BOTBODRAFT_60446 [Botryobasidium botryosum FD-172 SS1]
MPTIALLQQLPTPFMATFVLVHLTAPAVASLGGSSMSSQVMLLGREYYQGSWGETALVWAPFGIHVAASLVKRIAVRPRPFKLSVLTATAYPLLLLAPLHILTHRVYPSSSIPSISSLGPGELDYEFVKVGLETWPWRGWILYGGLVGCVALHSVEGIRVVWKAWGAGEPGLLKGWGRWIAAGGAFALVLAGVGNIAAEPLYVPSFLLSRIKSSYAQSWAYRV